MTTRIVHVWVPEGPNEDQRNCIDEGNTDECLCNDIEWSLRDWAEDDDAHGDYCLAQGSETFAWAWFEDEGVATAKRYRLYAEPTVNYYADEVPSKNVGDIKEFWEEFERRLRWIASTGCEEATGSSESAYWDVDKQIEAIRAA